ncbi:MAG: hypothetical protein ACSW8D_08980, partial [Prevotella sp.]
MRKTILSLLALTMAIQLHAWHRSEQSLNFGWRFHAGNIADAPSPSLDDSGWRSIDLPHDFQIEQPWVAPDA